MKFVIYRYLVGVLSLTFFMSQFVHARPAIIPISSQLEDFQQSGDFVRLGAVYQRCSGLHLFASVKTEQSGLTNQSEYGEAVSRFYAKQALDNEHSINSQLGLNPVTEPYAEREQGMLREIILSISLMYIEMANENYIRTGSHFVGVLGDDLDSCETLLKTLVPALGGNANT
tara:strand:- start:415 stop:930 length:516 start_codon:yes stop_codon:yes gene_type:complete